MSIEVPSDGVLVISGSSFVRNQETLTLEFYPEDFSSTKSSGS